MLVTAVAFALTIVLSGAIHLDGFLDCCDALFAPVSPARRLEILKDPRHGSFALAGLAVVAALWLAALGAIAPARLPATLAFCAALARWAVLPNAFFVPYARETVSRAFATRPALWAIVFEGALLLAAAFWFGAWTWVLVPIALANALLAATLVRRAFGGGLVGDAYGFLIVCLEVALLCVLPLVR